MRHKIKMFSNLGFAARKNVNLNKSDPFINSILKVHPKIKSRYDEESTRFNGLLEESRMSQIELIRTLEDEISLEFDFKTIKRVSPLDLKWSSLFSSPSKDRLGLLMDFVQETVSNDVEKRDQFKNYLFAEIGKGKLFNSLSNVHKENKGKKFDCITLEFQQNSYSKKALSLFSLLTKKGISIVSIPAKDYCNVKESLNKTDFFISVLCSQRDHDFDKEGLGEKLINQKFSRSIHSRYIVLVITRNAHNHVFIGSEFDESDWSDYGDMYLIDHLDPKEEASSGPISSSDWHLLPGFGLNCNVDDFYDLENLYNQIKYYELKERYLTYKKHSLLNISNLKARDIFRTFLYLNNIKNTGKISLKNKLDGFESHNKTLNSIFKALFVIDSDEAKAENNSNISSYEQYSNDIQSLFDFNTPDFFHRIDKLLIIEWRVDGANNCQYGGMYHPKDWAGSEEKYWDPNYYIECIEIDTKVVKLDYLLMFFKTQMGEVLIDLAIDDLNANGDLINPELWKHLSFFAPSLNLQSKAVEAINSIDNLTNTLGQSKQSVMSKLDDIDDIIQDVNSWQASLGLLNNSDRIEHLIAQGESKVVEFKQTFSLDIKTRIKKEIYMETACLKTICGFLNTSGGTLLIGVADDGTITGLSEEIELFHKNNLDNLLNHFKNKLTHRINGFDDFINYKAIHIKRKLLIEVTTKPIKFGIGCYLDEKDFYIRRNPGTDKLEGQELVIYNKKHFQESKL